MGNLQTKQNKNKNKLIDTMSRLVVPVSRMGEGWKKWVKMVKRNRFPVIK